jgi:hypothetical protein
MPLELRRVLEESAGHLLTRDGLVVVGATYLGLLPGAVALDALLPATSGIGKTLRSTPSADLSPEFALLVVASTMSVQAVVSIGATRTFVVNDPASLDWALLTDDLPSVFRNLLLCGLLYTTLVVIGASVFGIGAIYVAVGLYVWNAAVVLEGAGPVKALRRSWELTEYDRGAVFFLLIAVVAVYLGAIVGAGLVADVLPAPMGPPVRLLGVAAGVVFAYATTARAYDQMTHGDVGVVDADAVE